VTSRRRSQGPHGPAAPLPDATAPLAQYLRRAKRRLGSPEPAPEPARAPRNSARTGLLPFALLLCCCCAVAAVALLIGSHGVRLAGSGGGWGAFAAPLTPPGPRQPGQAP